MTAVEQTWQIVLSALAGTLAIAVFGVDLALPVFLGHLVFCGWLGWQRAAGKIS